MSLSPLVTPSTRCAIYTRKSVAQPTDQDFGSLEAQRAICSSYIATQRPRGWLEVARLYQDDGQSGSSLSRPGLQDLLADIECGMIDVVVIYKLDRISRTLLDFVRLMDLFTQFGVTFVAVTQNFDTAESTGRLILNVLLTFAQFEREITSDRLRDKFSAMRQKGMFVGGHPPFGYDLQDKKLVINQSDAKIVRWMFQRYLKVKSYVKVRQDLREMQVVRRSRMSRRGNVVEGREICVASVWNMLGNPLYVGDVRSKGLCYPGAHKAIVSRALWDQVQELREKRRHAEVVLKYDEDLLRDLMFDSYGRKMASFRDRRYDQVRRYYISNQTEWGRRHGVRRYRTKAEPLEKLILAAVASYLADRERLRAALLQLRVFDGQLNKLVNAGSRVSALLTKSSATRTQCALKTLVERIELTSTQIKILVRLPELPAVLAWDGATLLRGDRDAWKRPHATDVIDIAANSICMKRELTLLLQRDTKQDARPDRTLVRLLNKAREAQAALDDRSVWKVNELAEKIHCHPKRFTHLVRLNYLAPDIIASIRDGTAPDELKAQKLMSADLRWTGRSGVACWASLRSPTSCARHPGGEVHACRLS